MGRPGARRQRRPAPRTADRRHEGQPSRRRVAGRPPARHLRLREGDGRPFFILPWYGHTLVGTTDLRWDGDPSQRALHARRAALSARRGDAPLPRDAAPARARALHLLRRPPPPVDARRHRREQDPPQPLHHRPREARRPQRPAVDRRRQAHDLPRPRPHGHARHQEARAPSERGTDAGCRGTTAACPRSAGTNAAPCERPARPLRPARHRSRRADRRRSVARRAHLRAQPRRARAGRLRRRARARRHARRRAAPPPPRRLERVPRARRRRARRPRHGARLGWSDDRIAHEVAAYERELRETLVPVDALGTG